MLAFIGDIHGDFRMLRARVAGLEPDTIVIQVGDFGFWPGLIERWQPIEHLNAPVYAIEGNHEYFPMLRDIEKPTEIADGLVYVPRGTVLVFDDHTIGFMGGASTIDWKWRQYKVDWFPNDEVVTEADIARMDGIDRVDMLVAHTPPQSLIKKHFDRKLPVMFGVPDWHDPSADMIEILWERLGRPPLICGHMHRSIIEGRCRMLGVGEIFSTGGTPFLVSSH